MKKKTLLITYRLFAMMAVAILFAACKKDGGTSTKNTKTITLYTAVYGSKATALASINGNAAESIKHAGKIYIKDNFIFLNDQNKGIHVIDNSNPSHPVAIAFLSIPGNLDIAIKGNTLYADMYNDLLALDITDIHHAAVTHTLENFFTGRSYVNGFSTNLDDKVVTDWIERDTVVTEQYYRYPGCDFCAGGDVLTMNAAGVKSGGTAGSMAGMVLMNDHLYAITEMHSLGIVDISNPAMPMLDSNFFAGYDLQTVFPFKDKLFLGSAVGMFMYDVTDPSHPVAAGEFSHGRACDPVIADEHYAYVTLHAGDGCGGDANELHVIDINNLQNAQLVKTYQMTKPTGLSKDGNLLFVCDDTEVKVYNAASPGNLVLVKKIKSSQPYDVITFGNKAMVVCSDGLYQYDYSNINNIRQLSFVAAKK